MARRILIVEDDALNRMLFSEVLEGDGFVVELVADEREALAAAAAFQPDLIIMDIHLPNISGLRLIRMLKRDRALAAIPVLAVTGYVGTGEEGRVRKAGADGYLAKPVSIRPLLAAVAELLPPGGADTQPEHA